MNKDFNLTGCQYCDKFHYRITPSIHRSRNLGKTPYLSVYDCSVSCGNGAFKNTEIQFNTELNEFPSIDKVVNILMSEGRLPKDCQARHCFVGKDSRDKVLLDKLNDILRRYDIPEDKMFGISYAFGEELSKFK